MVHPMLSVSYRFLMAGFILFAYCFFTKKKMKFTMKEHGLFFILGMCLFGFNYLLVYTAEQSLESGLVSVVFSLIIFANIFLNRLFLKGKIKKQVMLGALLGFAGTVIVFYEQLMGVTFSDARFVALLLCLGSILLASTGNIISSFNQKKGLPVLQGNAYGMFYGGLVLFVVSWFAHIPLSFDFSVSYVLSLLYLSAFGSIIAFTAYLNLLGRIGPDKSAYTILVIPLIAMVISTIFEGYQWKMSAILGILLILSGNFIVLKKKKI